MNIKENMDIKENSVYTRKDFTNVGYPLRFVDIDNMFAISSGISPSKLTLPEIWTIVQVETTGCGFFSDRAIKCLFERHVFSRLTNGKFDTNYPHISNKVPGGYFKNPYEQLEEASLLDSDSALASCSWGLGQIMGYNLKDQIPSQSLYDIIMSQSLMEVNQLIDMINWIIKSPKLIKAIKKHNWVEVARIYNGPAYRKNMYDIKLTNTYANSQYKFAIVKNIKQFFNIREIQICLMYLTNTAIIIDGVASKQTKNALIKLGFYENDLSDNWYSNEDTIDVILNDLRLRITV